MAIKLDPIKKLGLCPSILNLYVDKYSFKFFINDLLSGIKIFLFLFPIAFSLSFFCGASPIQGVISCAIAAIVGFFLGGSKYQIASLALPVCVLTFEILAKYQYKGLFFTALFVSIILILFGILKISEVLKHTSYAFVSALSVYVVLSIIINQSQYILGINSIQSSQGLLENFSLLYDNISNINAKSLINAAIFVCPILILRSFIKGFSAFFIYLLLGSAISYAMSLNILPFEFNIKTLGKEMIATQSIDTIMNMSKPLLSKPFLANVLNYAFVISIIIASEACFCTNVSTSITGDKRLQTNMELISTGVANFASIAFGGLFVSPNINFSIKNITNKSKTVIPILVIISLCTAFILNSTILQNFIPVNCLSSILVIYASTEFFNKKLTQYLNIKSNDSYIFLITLILAIYFGFITAVIVGFCVTCIFFAKRMVNIKDASVHTTKNHDASAVEFMMNKNGFANSMNIPQNIIDKIEVIQVSNILFLNIAKVVEEALKAQGRFPKVLIVYFNNVPYLDGEAFDALRQLAKRTKDYGSIMMVSGTNGMLLDILRQRAEKEKYADVFGYIVPNFRDAINQTIRRLKN